MFDPLAVLLLIASQYTFQFIRKEKDDTFDQAEYERIRAQAIVNNTGPINTKDDYEPDPVYEDVDQETLDSEFDHEFVGLEDDDTVEDQ